MAHRVVKRTGNRRRGSRHSELRVRPAKKRAAAGARNAAAREKFARLARRWRRETAILSSTVDIAIHPAYQAIIGMGETALPFILESLAHRLDHWFWALEAITQADPVPRRFRGNIEEMARAWLKWGHERGLVAVNAKAVNAKAAAA